MKIYIDTKGVLRWSPNGWPENVTVCAFYSEDHPCDGSEDENDYCECRHKIDNYEDDIAFAKVNSIPVKDQIAVRKIMGHHYLNDRKINTNSLMWDKDTFYEVPDEEIKPEWL